MTTTPTTSERGRIARPRIDLIPRPGRRADEAAGALAVAASYIVLVVAALLGRPWIFAVGAAGAVAVELLLSRRTRALGWAADEVRFGPLARCLARGLAAVALLARCGASIGALRAGVIGWLVVALLAAAAYGLVELISLLRKAPVLSRGLDLGDVRVPRTPATWLVDERVPALADVPLLVAAVAVGRGAGGGAILAGLIIAVLIGLAIALTLGSSVLRLRAAAPRRRVPAAIAREVAALAPEVVLYHSGEPSTVYQVESWLRVIEQLGRPALVLLRDPATLRVLGPTTLPVVCIHGATTLVGFDLPGTRVGLFVANGTGNIHLLRRNGIGFTFIGHGDSDKASSSTPFARVYDEIWVAGPAGRERYERAGARLSPGAIVEVGRPQLASLTRGPRVSPPEGDASSGQRTVLYAPTWEGWGEETHHSSLAHVGPDLVRRLLAEPGVRVIYRPHPLAGTRDAATRRAHRAVLDLLVAAGASVVPDLDAMEQRPGDDLDQCFAPVIRGPAPFMSPDLLDPQRHLVVAGRNPGLLYCLEESDLLIADVSAVVSDWLATGRPYAVLNPGDVPAADLHASAPSTAAGALIGADLGGLDVLLDELRTGADPRREERAILAVHLLGPVDDDPLARFRAAVTALADHFTTP